MSRRLQVILDDAKMNEIRRIAQRRGLTVAEWVQQALRAARPQEPEVDTGKKLKVVRAAAGHSFPTADAERMLAEIEQGYLSGPTR